MSTRPHQVLLTGVTGFVGKVVLHDLLARGAELGVETVRVVIRPSKGRDGKVVEPATRFARQVSHAEIFSGLPEGWQRRVEVVGGDLESEACGLSAEDRAKVTTQTTHVIHCAASVDFDLPIAQAAAANITTALNVLALAGACTKLVGMTDVSTAYVSPWHAGPIPEKLAHLPRPAQVFYDEALAQDREHSDDARWLKETGHPNTYTLTKCVAEHLLCERRGNIPLHIVRPSIISATWQSPVPGWIDSRAALAGCLLYTGLGLIRVWRADPASRLDVVPVDMVSDAILEAAFKRAFPKPGEAVPILHATMGVNHALRIDTTVQSTIRHFKARPGTHAVPKAFIGLRQHGFEAADVMRREVPFQTRRLLLTALRRQKDRKRLEKADGLVRHLNDAFEYFTANTFDFRMDHPTDRRDFEPMAYIEVVNRALYNQFVQRDESALTIGGKAHKDARSDMAWLREYGQGSMAMRGLGLGLRKALRRCSESVTFDRASFEAALATVPPDAHIVLTPSHRSYLDFMLTSFLCFQHAELGIPVPHIAAADEFRTLPVVGRILQNAQAFYIRRGVGREVPEVGAELKRIADCGGSLMFFPEGQRSRARECLAPKRGLLRGLQNTGHRFVVLPIAVSYDRVPEENAFERELSGGHRSKMSMKALIGWLGELARNKVQLGRIHIACGAPQVLEPDSDVVRLADRIVGEQQRHMTCSSFHLRTFLAESAAKGVDLTGIDEAWLKAAIEQRGGRVFESELPTPSPVPPGLGLSLRNQWIHWFHDDLRTLFPQCPRVSSHLDAFDWVAGDRFSRLPTSVREDRRTYALAAALRSGLSAPAPGETGARAANSRPDGLNPPEAWPEAAWSDDAWAETVAEITEGER